MRQYIFLLILPLSLFSGGIEWTEKLVKLRSNMAKDIYVAKVTDFSFTTKNKKYSAKEYHAYMKFKHYLELV